MKEQGFAGRSKVRDSGGTQWYLVRTKPHRERSVEMQLRDLVAELYLPLLKAKTSRWGRLRWVLAPLFPCYLFARFDLRGGYFTVRYLPGVHSIVSAGRDPIAVAPMVVEEIRRRSVNGVVELKERPFGYGERVRLVHGPFKGFEAVFERYLSGAERVSVLLSTVEATGVRVVLSAEAVARPI